MFFKKVILSIVVFLTFIFGSLTLSMKKELGQNKKELIKKKAKETAKEIANFSINTAKEYVGDKICEKITGKEAFQEYRKIQDQIAYYKNPQIVLTDIATEKIVGKEQIEAVQRCEEEHPIKTGIAKAVISALVEYVFSLISV